MKVNPWIERLLMLALAIVNWSVALPMPHWFDALMVDKNVPAKTGMPEIKPVAGFSSRPVGRFCEP